MRLICPNCGAQYEVGEGVIPAAGRDVQCSNCGHTWFEAPGASEAAEMGADIPAPAPQPELTPEPEPEPHPEPEPETEPEAETEPQEEAEPEDTPDPELRPRELDPDVADILREEAEYEQAAREADGHALETQTDLDLSQDPEPEPEVDTPDPDEDRRSREARDRLARLRGEPEVAAAVGATMAQDANTPRRELLPDIEEINSSLRPDAQSGEVYADEEEAVKARSGFRRGFVFMILLAVIALAAYVFAPQISAAVPQLAAPLSSYVDWVDGLRIWLDQRVSGVLSSDV